MDTWGAIPKAQDDNQLIDEAIAAAISNHEADSEAHLGAGESLETHRAQDVIDHPAESIVSDKYNNLSFTDKLFVSNFQSVDMYHIVANSLEQSMGAIAISTAAVLDQIAYLHLLTANNFSTNFGDNPILDFSCKFYL